MEKTPKELDLIAFAERINNELDRIGYPDKRHGRQVQLAKDLKVDQKAVRRWLEAIGFPSNPSMKKLCQFLKRSESYIRYGVTSLSDNDSVTGVTVTNLKPDAQSADVPLISLLNIGKIGTVLIAKEFTNSLQTEVATLGRTVVEGSSMRSESGLSYPDGTMIYWQLAENAKTGDHVIAILPSGERIFRELDTNAGARVLRPLNTQYPVIDEPFNVIAVVTGKFEPVPSSVN